MTGPRHGRIGHRTELLLDSPLADMGAFAVAAPREAYALTRGGLYRLDAGGIASAVFGIAREQQLEQIVLLPARRILLAGRTEAITLVPRDDGAFAKVLHRHAYASSQAVGASLLLYTAVHQRGRVDGFELARPAEARSICRTDVRAQVSLAIAPGGDLLVLVAADPGTNRRARLERVGPLGEPVFTVELEMRLLGRNTNGLIVAPDGVAYVGFPGKELFAIGPDGRIVFGVSCPEGPAGFAGARGELLVARTERSLRVLDRGTGASRWEVGGAFIGPPKMDARGWIHARRGDDLVVWDPDAGPEPVLEVANVGIRAWDFALAGDGVAFAFGRLGSGAPELVVIE